MQTRLATASLHPRCARRAITTTGRSSRAKRLPLSWTTEAPAPMATSHHRWSCALAAASATTPVASAARCTGLPARPAARLPTGTPRNGTPKSTETWSTPTGGEADAGDERDDHPLPAPTARRCPEGPHPDERDHEDEAGPRVVEAEHGLADIIGQRGRERATTRNTSAARVARRSSVRSSAGMQVSPTAVAGSRTATFGDQNGASTKGR